MNIIDHLSLGVPNIEDARKFYDPVLATFDCKCLVSNESFAAYGIDQVQFLIMKPADGKEYSNGNGSHICFSLPDTEAVKNFSYVSLKNGGSNNGEPGPRLGYPKQDVYTTFVIDPFGNKLEAIHNGFSS